MDNTLKFADSHEWVKKTTTVLQLSVFRRNFPQEMLGDVVFVDPPDTDDEIEAGESFSS